MKIKRIACLAITAVMLATLCAFTASAATLTVSQNFGAMTANNISLTPADIGAYSIHGVLVDSKNNGAKMLCGTPQSAIGIGDDVTKGLDLETPNAELLKKANLSYAAYKLSADSGKCIDSVTVSINGMMNAFKEGDKSNQIGIYVTSSITADENGKIDFSALTPAAVFKNNDNVADFRSDEKTKTADISSAVAALGEKQDVYVIIAILDPWEPADSTWESGYDHSRCRLSKLSITATQKNVTVVETDPESDPNPGTSDVVMLSAISLLLVSGMAIAVVSSKKHTR